MEQFRKKFIEEAVDLVASLETALLKLENNQDDSSIIQDIFRIMHTLKGNSAMFGFNRIDEFTHHLESIYDLVRNNKMKLSKAILDITFKSVDHLKALLEHDNDLLEPVKSEHEQLMKEVIEVSENSINQKSSIPEEVKRSTAKPTETIEEVEEEESTLEKADSNTKSKLISYYIYFEPKPEIFRYGTNPLYVLDDISKLGNTIAYLKTQKIPSLEELETEICYVAWEIILVTSEDINAIKDVFIFVEDECNIEIEIASDTDILKDIDIVENLNSIGKSDKHLDKDLLKKIINRETLAQQKKSAEVKETSTKKSLKQKVQNAHKDKLETPECKSTTIVKDTAISSIRVSSDKLDTMMNLVSELVTIQARLGLFAEMNGLPELSGIVENMDKISRRLRDTAFNICLIPLESMLTRFQRLVRDVSSELGKDVRFVTEGAETELDKTIIESLADPIMHILRNSLDHGIENNDKRKANNKPVQGTIRLKAFYSGTYVYIEISDDGGGIDPERIREKAIQRGLLTAETQLTKKEILDFIFVAGFSTAAKVTELSGRGVGMDVVKRKITDIRGEVEVDSELGKGTTITIRLPLTLSIIDGLLVQIYETLYIIPLTVVNNIFATQRGMLKEFNHLVNHEGEQIPFINLRAEFNDAVSDSDTVQVIVVNYDDTKIGVVVDQVVGEYQAVLKPIGKLFKEQDFISGATILGDGSIALVMDTNRIIKQFNSKVNEK